MISYLFEQDDPVDIRDLSRRVAARENDVPVEDVTHEQRKRVYIALHQNHLPQLEDMGFVECGRAREAIALSDRAAALSARLDPEQEGDEIWVGAEIGLTLGGAVLLFLSWLDLYPLVLLPDLFYMVALVVALAVVTAVRCYRVYGPRLRVGS